MPITYWANGLVETFGPFLTTRSMGYNPDGEGRPYSFQFYPYLQSTTYNAAGQPTQLNTPCTSGTTCYPISYQYDPNTLRMTQYSWALNDGTVSGSLTWNPNGSLQQLVVADPFNSADAQTCTYGADDLSRINSVSCNSGSVWGQQFSYDAFGNLTKSVPTGATGITWQPGYSSSTNRYALGGTSYDANGNVLKDTFNIYTWDAEGKNLSTAYDNGGGETFSFTYDAFGHKVESSANGTYQASYVTLGNYKLSATGQTVNYSLYPLPGGSYVSVGGGLTGVQMADWLGTIRAVASDSGSEVQTGAHAPFGEEYSFTAQYPKPSIFTGQLDDGDDNPTTYYFQERSYPSSQGRWLSPDPAGLAAANPGNPQSWNRYAYLANSPLDTQDPLGLCPGCKQSPTIDYVFANGGSKATCVIEGVELPCDLGALPGITDEFAQVELREYSCKGDCGWYFVGYANLTTDPDAANNGQECDNACQLAKAINKTGVQAMTNPCTYGAFAAASTTTVALPVAGLSNVAAIPAEGGLFPELLEASQTVGKWLAPLPAAAASAWNWAKQQVSSGCNAIQGQ